jgi:hypothetical protein
MIKKCGYTVITSVAVEKASNAASLIDQDGNLVLNGLVAAPITH